MIPPFNISGVLPPFTGRSPADGAATAPYATSISEFVGRFAISRERIKILHGLLDYRAALKELGIRNGFQWINGSFVEDVEFTRKRPPADIDLVTFARRSEKDEDQWTRLVKGNLYLFNRLQIKERYACDAYYLDLDMTPDTIVADTCYWYGLFSHQRNTALWKGMVQISLESNDEVARQYLKDKFS